MWGPSFTLFPAKPLDVGFLVRHGSSSKPCAFVTPRFGEGQTVGDNIWRGPQVLGNLGNWSSDFSAWEVWGRSMIPLFKETNETNSKEWHISKFLIMHSNRTRWAILASSSATLYIYILYAFDYVKGTPESRIERYPVIVIIHSHSRSSQTHTHRLYIYIHIFIYIYIYTYI